MGPGSDRLVDRPASPVSARHLRTHHLRPLTAMVGPNGATEANGVTRCRTRAVECRSDDRPMVVGVAGCATRSSSG